jgi:hypothetical protein
MNINFKDLIELAQVPEVNRELAAAVEKWEKKGLYSYMKNYRKQKDKFYKKLFAGNVISIEKNIFVSPKQLNTNKAYKVLPDTKLNTYGSNLFWFELLQYEPFKWQIVKLEPFILPYIHYNKIFPDDIIERITESLVEPEKLVTMEGVQSTLIDKTLDIQFVHFSNNHIFGTFKDHCPGIGLVDGDIDKALYTVSLYKNYFPDLIDNFMTGFLKKIVREIAVFHSKADRRFKQAPSKNKDEQVHWPKEILIPRDHKDDNDVNLFRVMDLWRLPTYDELLRLKFFELKSALKKEIRSYEQKRDYYRGTLLKHRVSRKRIDKESPQPYWFIMTKYSPGCWRVSGIDPLPQLHDIHQDILGIILFNIVTNTPVDPEKVLAMTLKLSNPMWKNLDLRWVRYSGNCVMGRVCENIDDFKSLLGDQKEWLKGNKYIPIEDIFRLLFYHLRRRPALGKYFIEKFKELDPELKKAVETSKKRLIEEMTK